MTRHANASATCNTSQQNDTTSDRKIEETEELSQTSYSDKFAASTRNNKTKTEVFVLRCYQPKSRPLQRWRLDEIREKEQLQWTVNSCVPYLYYYLYFNLRAYEYRSLLTHNILKTMTCPSDWTTVQTALPRTHTLHHEWRHWVTSGCNTLIVQDNMCWRHDKEKPRQESTIYRIRHRKMSSAFYEAPFRSKQHHSFVHRLPQRCCHNIHLIQLFPLRERTVKRNREQMAIVRHRASLHWRRMTYSRQPR